MIKILNKIIPEKYTDTLNFNKLPVLFAATIIIVVRLISDILFYYLNFDFNFTYAIWQLFSGFFTVLLFFVFLIPNNYLEENQINQNNQEYFNNLKSLIIFLSFVLILLILNPNQFFFGNNNHSLKSIFAVDFIAPFILIVSLFNAIFIWKWLNVFKHTNTSKYLKYLFFLISYLIITDTIVYLHHHIFTGEGIFNSLFNFLSKFKKDFFGYFEGVIYLFIGILSYLLNDRNLWIQRLRKSNKYKLLFFSLVLIGFSISLFYQTSNKENLIYSLLFNYFALSVHFVNIIAFISLNYFIKILFSTLISLPNTDYMVQINSRLENLTELNKIILNSRNINDLLNKVNEFSLNISKGFVSWIETYEGHEIKYPALKNIFEENVVLLKGKTNLHSQLSAINSPLQINTLVSDTNLSFITQYIPQAKAITAIPLFDGEKRFGTIVIMHNFEYPLENEDLNILNAFAYNVGIAIEQNKLFGKSIENERYKKELALAQLMQKKLLPQKLPKINNFQVEAFSIAAEEVGGDYYDFFTLGNGNTCILLGDVSGKGISAAFVMAQVKGIALALAPISFSLENFIKSINKSFYSSIDKKSFITIAGIEIVSNSTKINYIRAGHTPLARFNFEDTNQNYNLQTFTPNGFGIGIVDENRFDSYLEKTEIELSQNDYCFVFTDGLNEARIENQEELGFEGSYRLFKQYVDYISEVEKNVEKEKFNLDYSLNNNQNNLNNMLSFREFLLQKLAVQNAQMTDDLSLVIIRFKG